MAPRAWVALARAWYATPAKLFDCVSSEEVRTLLIDCTAVGTVVIIQRGERKTCDVVFSSLLSSVLCKDAIAKPPNNVSQRSSDRDASSCFQKADGAVGFLLLKGV